MKEKILRNIPNPLKSKTKKFPYSSNNIQKITESHLSNLGENNIDVFLIRHAESKFNLAMQMLENNKQNLDLETYLAHKEKIRFGKDFIDADLTPTGISQCYLAGKSLHEANVDFKYVFVSPLKRTLMTCEKTLESLFSHSRFYRKPEIIVHPLLFEKVEDSCDLLGDIQENMKLYPHYNWELFRDVSHLPIYQLQHCDVKHSECEQGHNDSYYNLAVENFHKRHSYDHCDVVLPAMSLLAREEKFIESSKSTFDRLHNLKMFLNDYKFDGRILMVGHSVLFKHVTTDSVDEENLEPSQGSEVLKNCEVAMVNFH